MIADLMKTASVTATLAEGTVAVAPAVSIDRWDVKNDKVTIQVEFGPHASRVTFDTVLVSFNGGEPYAVRGAPDGLPISLPAGVPFAYELAFSDSYIQV